MENTTTAQHQFTTEDVVRSLRSLHGRHDRFGLAMEMTRKVGNPMQCFEVIQQAIGERKIRCIKIGKGDSARFDVELVKK